MPSDCARSFRPPPVAVLHCRGPADPSTEASALAVSTVCGISATGQHGGCARHWSLVLRIVSRVSGPLERRKNAVEVRHGASAALTRAPPERVEVRRVWLAAHVVQVGMMLPTCHPLCTASMRSECTAISITVAPFGRERPLVSAVWVDRGLAGPGEVMIAQAGSDRTGIIFSI